MIDKDAFVLSTLSSDQSFDFERLFKAYELIKNFDELLREKLDLQFRMVNLAGYAIDECQKMIKQEGISSVMSLQRIQEAVMPLVADEKHKYLIAEMLRNKLIDLSPSDEIIIVDNYIFVSSTRKDKDYFQIFKDIFAPIIDRIKSVKFITSPKHFDQNVFDDFENQLQTLNKNLSITCKKTSDFHDRFWIVDRNRGLFLGTSLNGIGKKYALVDVLRFEDVKEIINVLNGLKII